MSASGQEGTLPQRPTWGEFQSPVDGLDTKLFPTRHERDSRPSVVPPAHFPL